MKAYSSDPALFRAARAARVAEARRGDARDQPCYWLAAEGGIKEIEKDPTLAANLRTTCVATMIQGGTKENALPPDARANINCRILPGESVATIQARLASAMHDAGIELKPVEDFGTSIASPSDGEVPKAVEKITERFWPGTPVIPAMSRGATDSQVSADGGNRGLWHRSDWMSEAGFAAGAWGGRENSDGKSGAGVPVLSRARSGACGQGQTLIRVINHGNGVLVR